jgi:hypothetical protein
MTDDTITGPYSQGEPPPEPLPMIPAPAAEPSSHVRDLADEYHMRKIARDAAKQTYERHQAEYDIAEAALFDAIENAGLQSIRTPAGLFSLSDLAWPRIEDRERLMTWAENEAPELLTLNLQRLQTPLREALKDGSELPPGLGFTTSRKIRHTAPKG